MVITPNSKIPASCLKVYDKDTNKLIDRVVNIDCRTKELYIYKIDEYGHPVMRKDMTVKLMKYDGQFRVEVDMELLS